MASQDDINVQNKPKHALERRVIEALFDKHGLAILDKRRYQHNDFDFVYALDNGHVLYHCATLDIRIGIYKVGGPSELNWVRSFKADEVMESVEFLKVQEPGVNLS